MQSCPTLSTLPTPHDLKEMAAAGHQFTREQVRNLTEEEMAATGNPGLIPKGPAATIQSIYEAQQHSADKAEEFVGKKEVTKEAIRELGGHNPPYGSLGSETMHMVDSEED